MEQFETHATIRKRLLYHLIVWLILCWLALTTQHLESQGSSIPTFLHLKLWNPAVRVYETLSEFYASLRTRFKTREELISENQRLKRLLKRYQHIELLYSELVREFEGYEDFKNNMRVNTFYVLPARVVLFKPGYITQHELTLGKGSADGIQLYEAVLDENGLVGYINKVDQHTSRVRLISHPMFAIGVRIGDEAVRGVLEGVGRFDEMVIRYVPLGAPIEKGNIVYTSGLEGVLPPHIPVGEIIRSERSEEGDLIWKMKPLAHLVSLDWVRVLIEREKK